MRGLLCCVALLIALYAPLAVAIENSPITWAGNVTKGGEFYPPILTGANGTCTVGKVKAPYSAFQFTVNGTHPLAFVLQALFGAEWAPSAHVFFYEGGFNKASPCVNVSGFNTLDAFARWEMLVALRPGVHTVVITSIPRTANVSVPHSGLFVARLLPADSIARATNATDNWHPPIFHHPFNCQQQETALRPFLHDTWVSEASGPAWFNSYVTGLPAEVNTTMWVFEGNFTVVNGTVQNSCQAKFLTGATSGGMQVSAYVNVTKGTLYTVAVEFDHPAPVSYWGFDILPAEIHDSNRTTANFSGVPAFPSKVDEVFVCAPSGVQSKWGLHTFTAQDEIYALDFKYAFSNDTVLSLYTGAQTIATGCSNFLAAVRASDIRTPHRFAPLIHEVELGKNYTIIISSQSGVGGYYELIAMWGHNPNHVPLTMGGRVTA